LQFYSGKEFDVVVLAIPVLLKGIIHFRDLRSYLAAHGIPFSLTLLHLNRVT
jgi:hypothetical protein